MEIRRALVCSPVMPEFDRESGSRRVFHLIELLQDAGWSVTFFAENMAGGERYARLLRKRGVMVYGGIHSRGIPADAYLPDPAALLAVAPFDLVLVAFWYLAESLMPLVRTHRPEARVVVDSVDLHYLRRARKTFVRGHATAVPDTLGPEYASEMIRELNVYAAADAVFTVSQKEAALINDFTASSDQAYAVPDMEEIVPSPIPFAARKGILFVGNFRHLPNIQAVEYLFEQIVPRLDPTLLQRHPLYVVGNALTPEICAPGLDNPHVKIVGWVPSITPYLNQARVSIAPLRYGAGTKRKLIEALGAGTPSVSTSIGVEGLDVVHGQHTWIADGPEQFAAGIVRLLEDQETWTRLKDAGRAHVTATHGVAAIRARLCEVLDAVMKKPPRNPEP